MQDRTVLISNGFPFQFRIIFTEHVFLFVANSHGSLVLSWFITQTVEDPAIGHFLNQLNTVDQVFPYI